MKLVRLTTEEIRIIIVLIGRKKFTCFIKLLEMATFATKFIAEIYFCANLHQFL